VRGGGSFSGLTGLVLVAFFFFSCQASTLPARGQVVVVVDTNLPVVGDLADRPESSPSAAIDSVRIDVLDFRSNALITTQSFTVPERTSWPLSFGITRALDDNVLVRVRAFRALHALREATLDSNSLLTPQQELTIDRVATIAIPSEGVARARVLLSGDCIGRPASFTDRMTCVDAEQLSVPFSAPESSSVGNDDSAVGTWRFASDRGCADAPPNSDAVCIPGRMTIIGDPTVSHEGRLDSAPTFAALVSPFWIDKTEVTVGRYRRLDTSGKIKPVALPNGTIDRPSTKGAIGSVTESCTYLGAGNNSSENDALPMTCITPELAAEVCAADKGTLPSEVQWEYAARGRGRLLRFPWGEAPVTCCLSSIARSKEIGLCRGAADDVGPLPVGTHRMTKGRCDDLGDETAEGVLDLGGNVSEWTRDAVTSFTDPCWGVGLRIDPVCENKKSTARISRGSNWANSFGTSLAASRYNFIAVSFVGFRCVYPAEPAL
jgi:formylglycine-generating enzyme required for sulfatase activity